MMTHLAQRLAMAELDGHTNIRFEKHPEWDEYVKDYCSDRSRDWEEAIPDYLNDRDAVADVLEKLKVSQYPHFQEDYVKNLRVVVERELLKEKPKRAGVHWFEVLTATAAQQVEAILWSTDKYKSE